MAETSSYKVSIEFIGLSDEEVLYQGTVKSKAKREMQKIVYKMDESPVSDEYRIYLRENGHIIATWRSIQANWDYYNRRTRKRQIGKYMSIPTDV